MLFKMSRFLVLALVGILAVTGCNKATGPEETDDTITIILVTPDSGLNPGQATDFAVTVEYELVSADSGELNIGFNSVEIGRYHLIEEAAALIAAGTGQHQFNVSVITKDWGDDGDFEVYVNLSEHPHDFIWTPLATDIWALIF